MIARGPLLLAALALPLAARAEDPVANPGRPSFSDNASTTMRGAAEIETGVAMDPDAEGHATTLKYGFTDRVDLRFTAGGPLQNEYDVDAINLLLKATLQPPDAGRPGFAVEPYVNFPAPEGGDRYGYGVVFFATALTGPLQLDVNAIVDVAPAGENDDLWSVSPIATVGFPIAGDLGGFVEIASTVPTGGESPASTVTGAGIGWAVRPWIVLDACAHVRTGGLEESAPDWIAQAGFTFAFWAGRH